MKAYYIEHMKCRAIPMHYVSTFHVFNFHHLATHSLEMLIKWKGKQQVGINLHQCKKWIIMHFIVFVSLQHQYLNYTKHSPTQDYGSN